jgi:hypothetical protein
MKVIMNGLDVTDIIVISPWTNGTNYMPAGVVLT